MMKLAKYTTPFTMPLLLVFVLTVLQAYSELALPEILARLVNTGIQQSGIESPVPSVIRESELHRLAAYAGAENEALIFAHYRLLSRNTLASAEHDAYVQKYSALAHTNLYELNTDNPEILDRLAAVFEDAIVAATASPGETDSRMLETIVPYLKAEYEAAGVSMEAYANSYLLREGRTMLVIAFVLMFILIVNNFLTGRVSAGIGRNLRKDVFDKVVGFSSREIERFSTASLLTRTTNDVLQVQGFFIRLLGAFVYAPILGVGAILKISRMESSMAWIIAVVIAFIFAVIVSMTVCVLPRYEKVQRLVDRMNFVLREALRGMLVIRAFSNQKVEERKAEKVNRELADTNLFIAHVLTVIYPVMSIAMNGAILLILWFGAGQVDLGTMRIGDLMAFMNYTLQIISAFTMLSSFGMLIPSALVSSRRIVEVLETENSITDPGEDAESDPSRNGFVEFRGVSFAYPGADTNAIKNISFTAKPGETTAIIGSTGSGKTTAISLIPRFYDATEGVVLVNGVNVRDVTQRMLREQIGYVSQKIRLFGGTIETNIKYGGDSIADSDMHRAAEIAQAASFIDEKEGKYASPIAQGGVNVSGGQKQRLAIARAIAKKPRIFLFDDSMSALDYRTDAQLRAVLGRELAGVTVVMVAQRIGAIQNAEQIIVLDKGEIVGKGTHRELLAGCEVYRQIALSQLSREELGLDAGGKEVLA